MLLLLLVIFVLLGAILLIIPISGLILMLLITKGYLYLKIQYPIKYDEFNLYIGKKKACELRNIESVDILTRNLYVVKYRDELDSVKQIYFTHTNYDNLLEWFMPFNYSPSEEVKKFKIRIKKLKDV